MQMISSNAEKPILSSPDKTKDISIRKREKRSCLSCQKMFTSKWVGNRICSRCNNDIHHKGLASRRKQYAKENEHGDEFESDFTKSEEGSFGESCFYYEA